MMTPYHTLSIGNEEVKINKALPVTTTLLSALEITDDEHAVG